MFIKCHNIYLFLILTGGECLVQSPEDVANSYECQFFLIYLRSQSGPYLILLFWSKLYYLSSTDIMGSVSKFNHILTSLEYII